MRLGVTPNSDSNNVSMQSASLPWSEMKGLWCSALLLIMWLLMLVLLKLSKLLMVVMKTHYYMILILTIFLLFTVLLTEKQRQRQIVFLTINANSFTFLTAVQTSRLLSSGPKSLLSHIIISKEYCNNKKIKDCQKGTSCIFFTSCTFSFVDFIQQIQWRLTGKQERETCGGRLIPKVDHQ